MIAKTAEGLIGANNAMNVIQTPMKVFKEARARGDTETMKRAMGYVEKSNEEAWRNKFSADEGLKQEAEENKLKNEEQRKELRQRIKENGKELEERVEDRGREIEAAAAVPDSETSENGEEKVNTAPKADSKEIKADNEPAPVTYTKTGEVIAASPSTDFSINV